VGEAGITKAALSGFDPLTPRRTTLCDESGFLMCSSSA